MWRVQRNAIMIALASALVTSAIVGCSGQKESAPSTVTQSAAPPQHERHVALEGQPNFQDLGGYRTTDGRTVKWGQLYRSGELPQLSDADVVRLEELGIRTVVNFLLPREIEKKGPDRLPEGTRELSRPISGERASRLTVQVHAAIKSGAFDKIPPELNPEFHRLLLHEGKEEYAALLRAASDPANRPIVFHCSHGIHRTGTATAILLSALGVPWETVREDYLLSNAYRAQEIETQLARIRQMAARKQGIPAEQVNMANVEAFFIVKGSYIDATLEEAERSFGSMEAYIRDGLGISDQEIKRLRDELLN